MDAPTNSAGSSRPAVRAPPLFGAPPAVSQATGFFAPRPATQARRTPSRHHSETPQWMTGGRSSASAKSEAVRTSRSMEPGRSADRRRDRSVEKKAKIPGTAETVMPQAKMAPHPPGAKAPPPVPGADNSEVFRQAEEHRLANELRAAQRRRPRPQPLRKRWTRPMPTTSCLTTGTPSPFCSC